MDRAQIIALIGALSGTPDAPPPTAPAGGMANLVTVEDCPRPLPVNEIEGQTIVCGLVSVPEQREKPDGKRISLAYAILRSSSQFPEPDPVVYLEGGPGGSAMRMLPLLDRVFKPWRPRRDVVIFDQRSAGISGSSVNCYKALSANALDIVKPAGPKVSNDLPDAAITAKCVAELTQKQVPLAAYNTTQNAHDVSAVISALGFQSYNIYGISYGTKLALEVMRVAPTGVRSVIIDGVAPSWVQLYNSFAMKTDEAIQTVVDQCAADKICNATYPNLGQVFIDTINKAHVGEISLKGEKVTVPLVLAPIMLRNGKYNSSSITPYIPAYIYELSRGKETPTVEMLLGRNFELPKPTDEDVLKAAAKLPGDQQELVRQMLDGVAIADRAEQGVARSVEALRSSAESTTRFGPVARMFDQELAAAMIETLRADKTRLKDILADYAAMQTAEPSKERLLAFVAQYFVGAAKDRLSALITSMSAKEVDGSFAIIRRDTYASLSPFLSGLYLDIYACQEDRPFNSLEGYKDVTAKLRYPHLGDLTDKMAELFFSTCEPFKPVERANWHEPVTSAIPTLSFGSLYDVQTPASWAKVAIEKLSNAQAFMIPEAGHGAVVYQPCVAEMGVAFIDNPQRKFDNACAESIKIDWHIASWANTKK